MQYIIFYSWQSDSDSIYNRQYIRSLLDGFKKSFGQDNDSTIEVVESVGNSAGSPNISEKILAEIDRCNIFVCDITPVMSLNNRQMPNSNVMFELGYAVCRLGWERIICIVNEAFGKIQNMPFDIRQNRISTYKYSKDIMPKLELGQFLLKIINDYNEIERRFKSSQICEHDTKVFEKYQSRVNEKELVDGLRNIRQYYIYTGYDKKLWEKVVNFSDYPQNRYIIEELNDTFEEFVKCICVMRKRLSLIMYASHDWQCLDPLEEHTQEEIDNNLREERFGLHNIICKEYIPDDEVLYWNKIDNNQDEVKGMIDDVLSSYQCFIDTIKKYFCINYSI